MAKDARNSSRSEASYDLVVAGEINPDLLLRGPFALRFGQSEEIVEFALLTVGSSSVILACGAARLGLRVAFVGVCGDDLFGRFMLAEMSRRGIDVSHVRVDPAGRTGLSVILERAGDRTILTYPGLIGALRAEDVPDDLLRQARHLHVSSFFLQTALQPGLASLFARARTAGLTTSLDPNWDPSQAWHGVQELLPLVDALLPNEAEARAITGAASAEEAAEMLSHACPVVAIKMGARGALARSGEELVRASAPDVTVVDTVGAGDTFDAGFLYGFLHGWPLAQTLRLATVCGSLSARAAGGTAAQPTLDEAMAYVHRLAG
ncbi:MAG: carbohydrate kinase family protein [Chloroflexia bacterium]